VVVAALMLSWFIRLYYAYPWTDEAYVNANAAPVAHNSFQIVTLPNMDNQRANKDGFFFVVDRVSRVSSWIQPVTSKTRKPCSIN
jgi:multidrug resistance efflux pump